MVAMLKKQASLLARLASGVVTGAIVFAAVFSGVLGSAIERIADAANLLTTQGRAVTENKSADAGIDALFGVGVAKADVPSGFSCSGCGCGCLNGAGGPAPSPAPSPDPSPCC